MVVFGIEFFRYLLFIGWVIFVDVYGYIEKCFVFVVYEFCLCMGW